MYYIKQFKWTLLVALGILIAILMPGDAVPSVGIPGMDKVVHCGMFFVQTAVFYFEHIRIYKKAPSFLYSLLGIGIFAFTTEIMQLFAASRTFDLKDLMADIVGMLIAIGLWKSIIALKENRK